MGLVSLYVQPALAATEITGEVTAGRGDSVQVSSKPHQQARPRKGDTVAFSLDIKGIKVKAGSGTVATIEGDTLWVDPSPESKGKARLKAIAVIQATGQVDVAPLLQSKYQSYLKTQDHTI